MSQRVGVYKRLDAVDIALSLKVQLVIKSELQCEAKCSLSLGVETFVDSGSRLLNTKGEDVIIERKRKKDVRYSSLKLVEKVTRSSF